MIELLVVAALVLVLYITLGTSGSKSFQAGQKATCEKNLQGIYLGLKTYALDHNGFLPVVTNAVTSEEPLSLLIPRATTGTSFFICPGSGDSALPDAKPFAGRRISYAYYMGQTGASATAPLVSDRQVNTKPKLEHDPLFSADGKKPGANHNRYGGNVMFCDGSVRESGPAAAFALTNAPTVILLNPIP